MKNSIGLVLLLVLSTALVGCSGSENTGNTNVAVTNGSNQNVNATNEAKENVSATNQGNVSARNEYPENVVDEFIKSCEAAGSDRTFCRCVLDKVQGKYTFEEFSVIESKMNAGQTPDEFVEFTGKARAECAK